MIDVCGCWGGARRGRRRLCWRLVELERLRFGLLAWRGHWMEKLKGGVNAVLDRVCVGGGKVVQAFVRGMKCSKGCRGR